MDMSGMTSNMTSTGSDMDSSMSMGGTCQISMLLNYYTIDACFLSEHWQIGSAAGFAGTFFAIFFLSMAVECLRRLQREYDRRLTGILRPQISAAPHLTADSKSDSNKDVAGDGIILPRPILPKWHQQIVRAILSGSAFMTAFWLMLVGMYYNVYLLIAIFLGNAAGYLIFARDTVSVEVEQPVSACGC